MKTISISECHQFLTVDDMKFMAFDAPPSGNMCDDCYFQATSDRPSCELIHQKSYCMKHGYDNEMRIDGRSIIWMRIL